MTIEVATYIGDLQPVNPPSTDPRGQGDDHLRLLKQVLQNTFPGLEKAIYFSTTASKTADFSVVAADMNKTFLVGTGLGTVTATLPNGLAAGDAGWCCYFLKTSTDTNPMFIAPASGTLTSGAIGGLSKARRCIPGVEIQALWNGAGWNISRANALPVGSCIEFHGSTLPPGYEWPNGQTLSSSANYPEYNSANGGLTTLDKRGRIGVTLDNLGGSAAGRLAGGIINGTAVGNVGGTDTVALSVGQIPTITGTVSTSGTLNGSTATVGLPSGNTGTGGGGFTCAGGLVNTTISVSVSGSMSGTFTSTNTGGATPAGHPNLQPSIMVGQVLIVE